MNNKPSVWLQLYFVLASLTGLILIVISASSLINTLLSATILRVPNTSMIMPPQPMLDAPQFKETSETTVEQREALERWRRDYEQWQNQEKNRDYEAENRKRTLAWSIAMLITGIPVFALHAPYVFRQTKQA